MSLVFQSARPWRAAPRWDHSSPSASSKDEDEAAPAGVAVDPQADLARLSRQRDGLLQLAVVVPGGHVRTALGTVQGHAGHGAALGVLHRAPGHPARTPHHVPGVALEGRVPEGAHPPGAGVVQPVQQDGPGSGRRGVPTGPGLHGAHLDAADVAGRIVHDDHHLAVRDSRRKAVAHAVPSPGRPRGRWRHAVDRRRRRSPRRPRQNRRRSCCPCRPLPRRPPRRWRHAVDRRRRRSPRRPREPPQECCTVRHPGGSPGPARTGRTSLSPRIVQRA